MAERSCFGRQAAAAGLSTLRLRVWMSISSRGTVPAPAPRTPHRGVGLRMGVWRPICECGCAADK